MKPLRELLQEPSESDALPGARVAVLAAVSRADISTDLREGFDRVLFGLAGDEAFALDGLVLHALEVAWMALEQSGVYLPSLGSQQVSVWSDGVIDGASIANILGLDGMCHVHRDGAGAMRGLWDARAGLLCGDIDLALLCGRVGTGLGVVVLGRESAARNGLRGWVEAVAAGRRATEDAAEKVRLRAVATSGIDPSRHGRTMGLGGLFEVLEGEGPGGVHGVTSEVVVSAVVSPAALEGADGVAPRLLMLSARTRSSLRELVSAVVPLLETDRDVRSMAADGLRRAVFERRLSVPVTNAEEVAERLTKWLAGDRDAAAGDRTTERGIGFVFPPAGAQYPGMAGTLFDQEPAFRAAVMRCDRVLRRRLPRPLLSLMFPQAGREVLLDDPLFANPLSFVIGYALAELLRSWGIQPVCTVGCGVGEIVAATVAGAITVEEGLHLSVERGRLLRSINVAGGRVVLTGSEGQVRELIESSGIDGLDVVAVPVPDRAVVGGAAEQVEELIARAEAGDVRVERLTGHPAHTRLVEPLLEEYRAAAAEVSSQVPQQGVRWVSTVTGGAVEAIVGAEHWASTLRDPMRFAVACEEAYFGGCRTFVELSARPVMIGAGRRTLGHLPVMWSSALLGPESDDRASLLEAAAVLWTRGIGAIHDEAVRGEGHALPNTPFDRKPVEALEVPDPLFDGHGTTLIPDEPLSEDLEAMVAEAVGSEEGDAPHIAPPSLLDDKTIDENNRLSDRDYDIASFFSDEGDTPWIAPPPQTVAPEEEAPAPTAEPPVDRAPSTGPLHEVWEHVPLATADVERATWIVLADEEGLGDYLLALLTEAGHSGIRVLESRPYPRGDGTVFVPDPSADGAWDQMLDRLGTVTGPVRVIHLWALDSESHTEPWLALLRLLATFRFRGLGVPTYVVTRGLWGDEPSEPAALLWGAGRQLQVESPAQWGGAIDLDEDEDAEALLAHLLERASPPEVAFRGGARLARHLRHEEGDGEEPTLDMAGAWVLVGAIDATCLCLVQRLVARGGTKLVLLSSDAPGGKVMMEVLALQRQGVQCTMLRADLRDPAERERVKQRLQAQGEVSGVVVRLALSEGPVLGAPDAVGRDEVKVLEPLTDVLKLGANRIVWMPAEGLDPGEGSGWTAVVGPAVVQIAQRAGAAVVAGAFDGEAAVDGFLAGLRPGRVVLLP